MTIDSSRSGSKLVISLTGRLDTNTTPELETYLKTALEGVTALTIDLSALEYTSSAGLRTLLSLHKTMGKLDGLTIRNIRNSVRDVFELTGMLAILNIE